MMSEQVCTIEGCKRISRALCHCCNKNICLLHIKEHYDRFIYELNPLTDEINILENRLISIDKKFLIEKFYQQLEQWRSQCYKTINEIFEEKYQEIKEIINEKISQGNIEISLLRNKLTKLIEEQDASEKDINLIKLKINQINQSLDDIEHTSIQINMILFEYYTIKLKGR